MTTAPTTTKKWGVRSVAAIVIFVIAFIATPVALIGHWGHRTVTDTEQYLSTVTPLAASPEIQNSIAEVLTTQFEAAVDTEAMVSDLINNLLPNRPIAQQLVGPIANGIDGIVENAIRAFLASEAFQEIWIKLNTAAQKSFIGLLSGETSGPVKLEGDNVVLDISSVFTAVQQGLVDRGISAAANIPIPQTDKNIVLFNAPQLAQARFIYSLTSPVFSWILALVAALFVLAIVLARNHARATMFVGAAMIVWTVLMGIGMYVGESAFVNAFAGTIFEQSVQVFWNTMLAYFDQGLRVFFVYGIIITFAGWFCSKAPSALKVRGALTGTLLNLGSKIHSDFVKAIGDIVAKYSLAIRIIIVAIGALIMATGDSMNFSRMFWTLAWIVIALVVVEILIGARNTNKPEVTQAAA